MVLSLLMWLSECHVTGKRVLRDPLQLLCLRRAQVIGRALQGLASQHPPPPVRLWDLLLQWLGLRPIWLRRGLLRERLHLAGSWCDLPGVEWGREQEPDQRQILAARRADVLQQHRVCAG